MKTTAASVAAVGLLDACAGSGDDDDTIPTQRDGGSATSDAGGVDGGVDAGIVDAGTRDGGTPDSGVVEGWAAGGTIAMTAKGDYPNPFTEPPANCVIVAPTTSGPCTTENDLDREDVSEGWAGLPVRLAIRVVDEACAPVAGAVVKIWHTNQVGVYSGDTPAQAFCSNDEPEAIMADFFRGVRTTDADGVVYFDTCYPGAYPGRAIHIHFEVKSGATSYRISQLFFEDALTAEIFASHPDYVDYGPPDTDLTTDGVVSGISSDELAALTLDVQRMTDGAMLASKTVAVRS